MTPDDLLSRLDGPLSVRRRLAYLAVTFGGLVGAGLVGTLWATEPDLPVRTAVAFALLVAIGLGWAAFGVRALTRRAPLYARDRVLAGWLGLAAWAGGGAGIAAIAVGRGQGSWQLMLIVGVLGVAAAARLVTARRRYAALLKLRADLAG